MISIIHEHYQKLEGDLSRISQTDDNAITQSEQSMGVILQSLDALKKTLASAQFTSVQEEIHFFKEIKPKFTSRLIYHMEVLRIESKRPVGSYKTQKRYIIKQLDQLKLFFDENIDFYQYYRSGSTYLDEKYFVRNAFDIRLQPDPYVFDYDLQFSTSHDFKIGRILANEMLGVYLNSALAELEQRKYSTSKVQEAPKKKLLWTAPKAALIELVYGLQAAGVFNNSNADVRQIATYLQTVFNIDLGNYYRAFQEIRIRKSGRTNFIDQLKKKLVQRMDETDENPKLVK